MDIVAHSCSIVGVIVISKHAQFSTLANGNLCDVRHQIVGNAVGVLAYLTTLMCTDGIEITQNDNIPFGICLLHIHQHLLQHGFGLTVRIGAMSFGALFRDGDNGRITIDRRTGREYDILATMAAHYVQENEGACHIVVIILQWLHTALAHSLQASEMNDSFWFLCLKHLGKCLGITDISLVERNLLADNLTNAL